MDACLILSGAIVGEIGVARLVRRLVEGGHAGVSGFIAGNPALCLVASTLPRGPERCCAAGGWARTDPAFFLREGM